MLVKKLIFLIFMCLFTNKNKWGMIKLRMQIRNFFMFLTKTLMK